MKFPAILAAAFAIGCSSSVSVRDLKITHPPAAKPATIDIHVDKTKNNDLGEATALETGLKREFQKAGYALLQGGLQLQAEIIDLERGSTVANVIVGLGAGGDFADAKVSIRDGYGATLMSFVVRGSVHDKRYRDLHEVLSNYVAQRVAEEVAKASR